MSDQSERHVVTCFGSGAYCTTCDWFYSPGCGHNAERYSYEAAIKHEQEHNEPPSLTVATVLAMVDSEIAQSSIYRDSLEPYATLHRLRKAIVEASAR